MKKLFKILCSIFIFIFIVAIIAFFIIANGDFKNTAEALIHGKAPLSLLYGKTNKGLIESAFVGVVEKVGKDLIVVIDHNGESKKVDLYLTVKIKNPQGGEDIIEKVPVIIYIAEKERPDMIKPDEREKRFNLLKEGQAVLVDIRDNIGTIQINESVYTGK